MSCSCSGLCVCVYVCISVCVRVCVCARVVLLLVRCLCLLRLLYVKAKVKQEKLTGHFYPVVSSFTSSRDRPSRLPRVMMCWVLITFMMSTTSGRSIQSHQRFPSWCFYSFIPLARPVYRLLPVVFTGVYPTAWSQHPENPRHNFPACIYFCAGLCSLPPHPKIWNKYSLLFVWVGFF